MEYCTYTESGTYTRSTDEGCTNVATLTLIINNSTPSFTIANDCDSYDWNGVTYTESGTYTYESTSDEGCINVATLTLVIIRQHHRSQLRPVIVTIGMVYLH